jgi:L-lysine exporter family protein LysE/ArgO
MTDVTAVLPGLLTGLSLIAAIGAQNAFVIRQGLTRRFVFEVIRWFGVAYLVWFGIGSIRRALNPERMSLDGDTAATRRTIVLSTVTFSLLNPHVYLDTVVFLGSVANQFADSRWWFALGACLASFVWFFSIAYGARSLARYVANVRFWQVLDSFIALTMFTIAGVLAFAPLG